MLKLTKRPYSYCLSGNVIRYDLFSDEAKLDGNVYIQVKVLFSHQHNAVPIDELITFDLIPINGAAYIDLKEVLNSQLKYGMPVKGATLKDATECPIQTGVFYIQYRQVLPGAAVLPFDDSEKDHLCRVVKGGIPTLSHHGNNFWKNYFFRFSYTRFFTWQITGRLAGLKEHMFLCWLNTSDTPIDKINVNVNLFFTDGTDASYQHPVNVNKFYACLIPSGAIQWDLEAAATAANKKIYYWEVQVIDITDPGNIQQLSEVFRYFADNRNDYNQRVLHYRNSLGGLDSVSVRGVIETSIGHNFQEVEMTQPETFIVGNTVAGMRSVTNGKEQATYKGDVGYMPKEEQGRFRDALVKREAYEYVYSRWYPVLITNKDFSLRKSTDKRFSFPIEWTLAVNGDLYYAPDIDFGSDVAGGGGSDPGTCECLIGNWVFAKAYNGGNTICTITHNFNVICSDDEQPTTKVQWRIPGYVDQWQDWDIATGNLVTNHAVPLQFKMELRPVCADDGSPGVTADKFINTAVGSGANCIITNNTSQSDTLYCYVNDTLKGSGYLSPGQSLTFTVPDASDVQVMLLTGGISVSFVQLQSNGITYPQTGGSSTVLTFDHVNIVTGFSIVIA